MRKLIDIPQDTFVILTDKARQNGINLKRYIENLLCDDAGTREKKTGYNLSLQREPTDNELKLIMQEASEAVAAKAMAAEDAFFKEISRRMNDAQKNQ